MWGPKKKRPYCFCLFVYIGWGLGPNPSIKENNLKIFDYHMLKVEYKNPNGTIIHRELIDGEDLKNIFRAIEDKKISDCILIFPNGTTKQLNNYI